jgi:tight adherence protein B
VTVLSIFLIVLITAFAVLAFFTEPSKTDKQIHSRLASLDRKRGLAVDDELSVLREVTFSSIPALDTFLRHNRLATGLCLLIDQSGLQWTIGRVVFTTLVMICVGALLGNWWIAPGLLGWAPGLALGVAPYVFLLKKRTRRFRRIAQQLPEAIDLMSSGLRAGQALASTVETVAKEAADPLASEFRRAAVEQSFGLPFRDAMLNLRSRTPVSDLQFLVAAILVQKETGGNLAHILDKTSRMIRERMRVAGEMRIRTAQARITGWALCLLPFVMFIGMNFLHPGYGKVLFENPLGQKMLTWAAVLMAIGVFIIRRIVRVVM